MTIPNLRSLLSTVTITVLLFSAAASAQRGVPEGPVDGHILFGDLKIEAGQTGTRLPLSFVVVLYSAAGLVIDRQTIANNGRYRFMKIPNGDYEMVVEAESNELVRIPFLLNEGRFTEIRKDLVLEWKDTFRNAAAAPPVDRYPRSSETGALMEQALAAVAGKDYEGGAALLKQVVQADPKDFEAWSELGTTLFMKGDHGEAEKAYRRALENRPGYPVALLNLGKLQVAQKKYDAAVETLARMVGVYPDSADAHLLLGEAYLQTKKGSRAKEHFERAITLDPAGKAEAHLRLAALYNAAGYKNLAAAEYEKFLSRRPDYPDRPKLEKYIKDNKGP
ncbi:MAG: tetratricopeptide repeat protein [Acidobacteria bacterium]|nr:tetratricopeptide repeat protein [Acidobacteriota bacterium]